jgi:hypothetical protein
MRIEQHVPKQLVALPGGFALLGATLHQRGGPSKDQLWLCRFTLPANGPWGRAPVHLLPNDAQALLRLDDGGLVVVGGRWGKPVPPPPGFPVPRWAEGLGMSGSRPWMARLGEEGELEWEREPGVMGVPGHEHGFNAGAVLRDGTLLAVGSQHLKGYVAHVTGDGALLHTHALPRLVTATHVAALASGGGLVLGTRALEEPDARVVCLVGVSSEGAPRWARDLLPEHDGVLDMVPLGEDSAVVLVRQAGHVSRRDHHRLLCLDHDGTARWEAVLEADSSDHLKALAVLPGGDIIVAGLALVKGKGARPSRVVSLRRVGPVGRLLWEAQHPVAGFGLDVSLAAQAGGRLLVATREFVEGREVNPLRMLLVSGEGHLLHEDGFLAA